MDLHLVRKDQLESVQINFKFSPLKVKTTFLNVN